jgi:hypothetical protein
MSQCVTSLIMRMSQSSGHATHVYELERGPGNPHAARTSAQVYSAAPREASARWRMCRVPLAR